MRRYGLHDYIAHHSLQMDPRDLPPFIFRGREFVQMRVWVGLLMVGVTKLLGPAKAQYELVVIKNNP